MSEETKRTDAPQPEPEPVPVPLLMPSPPDSWPALPSVPAWSPCEEASEVTLRPGKRARRFTSCGVSFVSFRSVRSMLLSVGLRRRLWASEGTLWMAGASSVSCVRYSSPDAARPDGNRSAWASATFSVP